MRKKTIAHYLHEDLKPHHRFIYNQIVGVKSYRSIVIGPFSRKSSKRFPIAHFYNVNKIKNLPVFLKQQGVIAIHAHHGGQAVKALPLLRKVKVPLIVSIRGRDGSARPGALKRNKNRYKKLRSKADMVLPVSQDLAQDLQKLGFPSRNIHVLYGGINLNHFRYSPRMFPENGEIRILSVGRLVSKKGHHVLLEAFARVYRQYPRLRLSIIGEGEERKRLMHIIKKHQLNKVAQLKGRMSNKQIATEMKHAHIFCLASQTASDGDIEGIPNVLKEAMATGLPVVSTRNGGIPELVRHKRTGYLVPERNVKALARGLRFYMENPEKRAAITKRARGKIRRQFELEKCLQRQAELYEKIKKW